MTLQNLTLSIPASLYQQIKHRALERERSVEDETVDLLAHSMPGDEQLPDDLATAVSSLELLENDALLRAAQSHIPKEVAQNLESLHIKRQREGLTVAEQETLAVLLTQYERAMLIRARAAVLLRQRGLDVPYAPNSP